MWIENLLQLLQRTSTLKKIIKTPNPTPLTQHQNKLILAQKKLRSILKAKEIGERIIHKMKEYVEVFVKGMVA